MRMLSALCFVPLVAAFLVFIPLEGQCQTDSVVRVMYWDLTKPDGVLQGREEAVVRVVSFVQPDVLIAQFLPDVSDTGVLIRRFNEIHGENSRFVLYSHFNRLFIAINRALVVAPVIHGVPSEYGNQSGVSLTLADGQCLGVLVGNWQKEKIGDTLVSHYEGGTGILAMASSVEYDSGCPGRVLVMGTLNARESSDPGLQQVSYDGFLASRIVDLAGAEGRWDSIESFSRLHTSSTTEGLVERSVMAMASQSLLDYISTWFIVGNDGNHFGRNVSDGANDSVPEDIADALELASVHLPIVVDVSFQRVSSVDNDDADRDLDLE